jgi:hypothetical protein
MSTGYSMVDVSTDLAAVQVKALGAEYNIVVEANKGQIGQHVE